jgi:L-aspartate oxidase
MQSAVNSPYSQPHTSETPILVIGSGVAGLSFALKMAEKFKVTIVAKSKLENTNTAMAQGGIATVTADEDDFINHIHDTQVAGAGLCNPKIVEKVVHDAPQRILELENWGVNFDSEANPAHGDKNLTREGGHSHRRILHVQDHTGLAIQESLVKKAKNHPNISILENLMAIDLITQQEVNPYSSGANRCLGAHFFEINKREFLNIFSRVTFLATGGAGKSYLYTSNWEGATGDGIAMAYRAGCRIANMEFMQFHPTCLFHHKARNFLISEALRGEGAELVNKKEEKFTYQYHPSGPLAPRDIVARAMDAEMKKSGEVCVYLDIRHKGIEFIQKHFPFIYERCLSLGYDLSKDLLPVVPAAHYLCGGIYTDEHGRTDLEGLFAAGECSCTGLHGANRLASNSLLECLSFAHYSYEYINENIKSFTMPHSKNITIPLKLNLQNDDELMLISHLWDEIRSCMWNYVGIVRSNKRLTRALTRIKNIEFEINDYYKNFSVHPDIIELRNLACVARLTIECAIQRQSSVGTHFNVDLPSPVLDTEPRLNFALPGFSNNYRVI